MGFQVHVTLLLLLPLIVAPDDSLVQSYGPHNFRKQIEQLDGNFIMFYAPWCQFCIDFHPIWQELAELVNTPDSMFAIAEVDCTANHKLCNENDITGYPTLLYFHKNTFQPVEYKGTRDLPSLTLFLSEAFTMKTKGVETSPDQVQIYSGMAHLNDNNIEKFLATGQHFLMFYASWCKASQRLAPTWASLAVHYARQHSVRVGKVNCMDSPVACRTFDVRQYPTLMWIADGRAMGTSAETSLPLLQAYVARMLHSENHAPAAAPRAAPAVARLTDRTFHAHLQRDLVFVNYFAPWCAHCMQLSPLWLRLGQRFQNDTRVLIADVDCARSKSVCSDENINGLPTLVLYKNRKIVNIEQGSKPLESLVSLVSQHLDPAPLGDEDFPDKETAATLDVGDEVEDRREIKEKDEL